MKARVISTGEIVEVKPCKEWTTMHGEILTYISNDGVQYSRHELSFKIDDKRDEQLDYWTKLEHQYAGMAMQALIIDASYAGNEGPKYLVEECTTIAHALVEKYKKEEKL